jgi:hypothetical protein
VLEIVVVGGLFLGILLLTGIALLLVPRRAVGGALSFIQSQPFLSAGVGGLLALYCIGDWSGDGSGGGGSTGPLGRGP